MKVLGIDLKYGDSRHSGTGLTIIQGSGNSVTKIIKAQPASKATLWERQGEIIAAISAHANYGDLTVIEDYAFSQHSSSDAKLKELGGLVKYNLWQKTGNYPITLGTMQLVKWALGKGSGKKNLVLKAVYKRFNKDFEIDDEADSYICADVGWQLLYVGTGNARRLFTYEQEVLKKLEESLTHNQALSLQQARRAACQNVR